MKTGCELLAPAGSMESVYAAAQSGADAIYIGGTTFSARASAGNFTNEEIKDVVNYCHLRGVKVHAALNTLIKQEEFDEAFRFAVFLYNAGIDALIIQDIGLAMAIKEKIPDFQLHGSTQMTIHNVNDAKVLKELGFSRVVVSRELSFDEIKKIKSEAGIEVEMFIHGAICQSYSGQCLFSSLLGGRSGNRGRCAQPCRLEYEFLTNGSSVKKGYLLSPKDMCLAGHLNKIKSIGIDSLKIEGRLKRGEYVAAVVGVYRKYLDTDKSFSKEDLNILLNAFNRSGFTDGYFTSKTGSDMMSYKTPSNIAEEQFESSVARLIGPNANERRVKIDMLFTMKRGGVSTLKIRDCDNNQVCISGKHCEDALSKAADFEFAKKQLSRLGSTVFELNSFEADIDEGLGIGASELNELRRQACEELEKARTRNERFCDVSFKVDTKSANRAQNLKLTVQVQNLKQAQIAVKYGAARIYAPKSVAEKLVGCDSEVFIKCDDITQNPKCDYKNMLSSHLSNGKDGAAGDFRLNVYNSESIKAYKKIGFSSICISPELNFNEIRKLNADLSECEILVYGKLPLMLMKNCVIKAISGKCGCGQDKSFYLKDRKREMFTLFCNGKSSCTNTLLNAKPIYMADKMDDIKKSGIGFARLMFWDEGADECEQVLKAYFDAKVGKDFEPPECGMENKFTRGHFYRGVI